MMNRENGSPAAVRLPDSLDCFVSLYSEKIKDNGEDAYLHMVSGNTVVVGAFDGCGGAGAKRLERLEGKTGAYAASRIASGTVRDYFAGFSGGDMSGCAQGLKESIVANLRKCSSAVGGQSRLISSVVKSFPTTAAFAACRKVSGGLEVNCFWAGDSRVYCLSPDGLFQLTADDLSVQDAMDNLYDDGVMTNVISLSADFTLHHHTVVIGRPCVIFGATDGCFGYITSPMEFEYMLLDSLLAARSVSEWEKKLHALIGAVSGDDYALCGAAFGHGGFEAMQKKFAERRKVLQRDCISKMENADRARKTALWESYRENYYRYLPTT